MSRIGKKPIAVPQGVKVQIGKSEITIEGPKGTIQRPIPVRVRIELKDNVLSVNRFTDIKQDKALHGLMRSLLVNMIKGVTEGYVKELEIIGLGYKAQVQGKNLNILAGFSHPVNYEVPDGVTVETPSQTEVLVRGVDKQKVGQVAAEIRAYRPPEPYKGKGVRYADERVVIKEAKKK